MRNMLIPEPPLLILPSLAQAIGLNEAILLQQLHYWIAKNGKERDGRLWVYQTYEGWKEQFPFWSIRTIKRIVESLRLQGLIITTNDYNQNAFDRTLWYSINYQDCDCAKMTQCDCVRLAPSLKEPETTIDSKGFKEPMVSSSETTPEINTPPPPSQGGVCAEEDFERFWQERPRRLGADSKQAAKKAWNAAIRKGADPAEILEGQRREVAFYQAHPPESARLIPMRSTWLNQSRWECDYDPGDGHLEDRIRRAAMELAISAGDSPSQYLDYWNEAERQVRGSFRNALSCRPEGTESAFGGEGVSRQG